jgi:hypothetical protein
VSLSLYVYYRVADPSARATRDAVTALMREVARETGVHGRLLRRADEASTWMEVYEPVTDAGALLAALDAGAERHGIGALLAPGARRTVERFVPCA